MRLGKETEQSKIVETVSVSVFVVVVKKAKRRKVKIMSFARLRRMFAKNCHRSGEEIQKSALLFIMNDISHPIHFGAFKNILQTF